MATSATKGYITKGQMMYGAVNGDDFGDAVAMSADGDILAVGAEQKGKGTGYARVYQFNDDLQLWEEMAGSPIQGAAFGDQFGSAVALSLDGTVLAVGADRHDGDGATSLTPAPASGLSPQHRRGRHEQLRARVPPDRRRVGAAWIRFMGCAQGRAGR